MTGWIVQDFDSCIEPVKYGTKIKRADFQESGEYPIISQEAEFINGYWNDKADLYVPDRPVVIFGDHTKALKYVDFPFVLGADGVKILKPKTFLEPKFFYYWLQSVRLESLGYARHYRLLLEQVIAYPPLPEQKRIVAILDEAFAGIAAATANAEKNLANARELFESYLQAVFTRQGANWRETALSKLCERITVGHVGSMAERYTADGIPFLRSQNIRPFEVSLENVVFIDETFHSELAKSKLHPGDIAIVRTGYPGTAAVIPPWLTDANCSDLVLIRPGSEVNPHYLAAFFNSAYGKELVLGKLVGAAQKHFNVTAAKEVELHYPPLPEQDQIVAQLDTLRAEVERLTSVHRRKRAALNELKQAILQNAFSGELTALPGAEMQEEAA